MKWFSLPIVFENLLCLVSSFYRVQPAFRIFTLETRAERERDSFSPNNSARKWNARKEMGITRSLLLTDVPVLATIFFRRADRAADSLEQKITRWIETNFSLYNCELNFCVQNWLCNFSWSRNWNRIAYTEISLMGNIYMYWKKENQKKKKKKQN